MPLLLPAPETVKTFRGGRGTGRRAMMRKPEAGGERRQAPGVALPADLGRSLRLLDDDGLDRLVKAVIEEARRRGRSLPAGSSGERRRVQGPVSGRSSGTKKETPDEAGSLTPGQERLILAAWEAGLKPAAIAREVRVSRPTVQHVITGAKRDRRRTER